MTVEVRISSVFTPDGSPPRSERRAVHVGRTDCTDPDSVEHQRTPSAVQVVINSVSADTEPPSPKFEYANIRLTSGFSTHPAGKRSRRRDVSVGLESQPGQTLQCRLAL